MFQITLQREFYCSENSHSVLDLLLISSSVSLLASAASASSAPAAPLAARPERLAQLSVAAYLAGDRRDGTITFHIPHRSHGRREP